MILKIIASCNICKSNKLLYCIEHMNILNNFQHIFVGHNFFLKTFRSTLWLTFHTKRIIKSKLWVISKLHYSTIF